MDLQKIRELIDLVSTSSLSELELTEGGETIRLSKQARSTRPSEQQELQQISPVTRSASVGSERTSEARAGRPAILPVNEKVCSSPMVGTFYRASSPGEAPFVEVGDEVAAGQTICVVEAMKMLNEVESEFSGRVKTILVENGKFVEYGQALFVIE